MDALIIAIVVAIISSICAPILIAVVQKRLSKRDGEYYERGALLASQVYCMAQHAVRAGYCTLGDRVILDKLHAACRKHGYNGEVTAYVELAKSLPYE